MYKLTGLIFVLLLLTTPAFAQDLKIEKDGDPDPVRENGTLSYTLTATNTGPSSVTGAITVTDKLPKDVRVLGVFTSDTANCTVNGRDVKCVFASLTLAKDEDVVVTINAQPQTSDDLVNEATVESVGDTTTTNNTDEITTEVTTEGRDGRRPGGRAARPPRIPPNAIRQYEATSDLNQAESDLQDAENELSVDEATLSEDPGNSDENGAEASTPGAVASANGDEDTLGPVGPQGDVVNDIPESGPLPNTGGISLLALAMPVLGVMLLGVALIRRLW